MSWEVLLGQNIPFPGRGRYSPLDWTTTPFKCALRVNGGATQGFTNPKSLEVFSGQLKSRQQSLTTFDVSPLLGVDGDCPTHYPPAANMGSPSGKRSREYNLRATSQTLACPDTHPKLPYLQMKYYL